MKENRIFTPAEFSLYAQCVAVSKERFPALWPEDRAKDVRHIFNQNIQPNMRTLEEIEYQSYFDNKLH